MADTLEILVATDFRLDGTGYQTIAGGICTVLAARGCNVHVLGKGYDGRQHDYPFQVIPTHYPWLPQHIATVAEAVKATWVLMMLDVPKVLAIVKNLKQNTPDIFQKIKVAAAFPVESGPFSLFWAKNLRRDTACRFTFTEFGAKELKAAGLTTHRLTVGVDPRWGSQELLIDQPRLEDIVARHKPYIVTVANNQLRKNLIETMEVAKRLIETRDIHSYVLVTDLTSADGWDLASAAKDIVHFPMDRLCLLQIGLSPIELKLLYDNASATVLLSLAEGIGLPIYESQACGVPTVGVKHTGMTEALSNSRLAVQVRERFLYPWGNVWWHWPDIDDAVAKTREALQTKHEAVIYPSWDVAASQMLTVLNAYDRLIGDSDAQTEEAVAVSNESGESDSESVGGGYSNAGLWPAEVSKGDVGELAND